MKVEQVVFKHKGGRRLFYVTKAVSDENTNVVAHCYTASQGRLDVELKFLESYLWELYFKFETAGKYAIVILEADVPELILLVTIC